ncbi:MAG TPA: sulfide/dihydroorotate dehydrogenase-like FAD/NAD-binding protein [Spirochaetota bacterium]|nr:sulfide/dihydroorotate dehydrogenase-like FAD/NAD-binding protein [Spirochaetota bacterium]HPI90671.1 sulfide/dihydroorotate dehydrogenase-like FAD/NAD-binding protein [Spirochaetota bacterium]HPR49176.1 sulfide/dihydroorotate dehydrogenase-like FAD/NAD-binding protein [Spirochaetota bacterium]
MHKIISNDMILENVGRMIVEAPYVAEKRKAGQFIILRIDEYGERIPLTIGDADASQGTITLFYQVVGKSTKHLSMLKAGDVLSDIAGPLGRPTEIENYGTVACVGGGIGVAPLYPIASAMKQAGNRVVVIIGARNKELLILEKELGEIADGMITCTDDGSYGKKAFVTEALAEAQDSEKIDLVVAIGPVPMMRAVSRQTEKNGTKTMVSLNSIMIDGTGMCGGCRVTVGGERRFTCVDGPEFDGHKVDFDELMARLGTYKSSETESLEKYEHKCRLQGAVHER